MSARTLFKLDAVLVEQKIARSKKIIARAATERCPLDDIYTQ
jgi:hypothetical protein